MRIFSFFENPHRYMDNSGYNLPETTRIFFCIPHKISINFLSKSKRKFVEKEMIRDMSIAEAAQPIPPHMSFSHEISLMPAI